MKRLLWIVLAAVLLSSCNHRQHPSRLVVILLDTSGSIEPDAEKECMDAISKLVERIDRGDKVSIIPITGDADVQSTGRVLRFQKPPDRTAYDADLVQFSKQVQQSLEEFRTQVISHPTSKTDIFGGIRMASEEFAAAPTRSRTLIIFSDFIEDDGRVDFKVDRRLTNANLATQYAVNEAQYPIVPFDRLTKAYLGLLRSKDLAGVNQQRREAIRAFWSQYLKHLGLEPTYVTDGIGLLSAGF